MRPTKTSDVVEIIRAVNQVRIVGTQTHKDFSLVSDSSHLVLGLEQLSGIVDLSPEDQVVVVKGGTSLGLVQMELGRYGQCLPLVEWYDGYAPTNIQTGTVAGSLSMNMPHYLEAECGNWRDWILGMTVVLADGTICKSGSHAVKNVAGYDVHKLFVGSRGALGCVTEVILRTSPVKSLPDPVVRANRIGKKHHDCVTWIQKVAPAFFDEAWNNCIEFYASGYPNSSTIWCSLPQDCELPRFPGDWVIRSGCGEKNLQLTDPTQIALMKRAKAIFDPTNKLNPGEWGFM